MKKQKLIPLPNPKTKEWIVKIDRELFRVFKTKEQAERFCARQAGQRPKKHDFYQQLPTKSVWTGAPWDHSFKNI